MKQMQELLSPINQHLTLLSQHIAGSSEQITEMSEQLRKLGRLQYKSGQEAQGKFEGLNNRLDTMLQCQDTLAIDKARLDTLERQIAQVSEILLVWLDDLDLLAASLKEQGQTEWLKLLGAWTHQVLQALRIHGIVEMQLVGTSFNPTLAEAIGTVARQLVGTAAQAEAAPVFLPYEIAEVVKRGFIYQNGTLLRKAQVITFQGDDHE